MLKKLTFLVFIALSTLSHAHSEKEGSIKKAFKKIRYELSLSFNKATNDEWWTYINSNLILGAIPLKDKKHDTQLESEGVTRILTLLEPFEQKPGWFSNPVSSEDWSQKNILVREIQAQDFSGLTIEDFNEGTAFIDESLRQGERVYVHCKAGRGRSASMVIAYLMVYQDLSFEDAYEYAKWLRPQISINKKQRQALLEYENWLRSN